MLIKPLSRRVCWCFGAVILAMCIAFSSCGLTAFAATETAVEVRYEPIPADVQTVIDSGIRKIVKTYVLSPRERPDDIPRADFTLDGWQYSLSDITEKRLEKEDVQIHTETVTISTDSNEKNAILSQFAPLVDYESPDGYCGLLTLDSDSVKAEPSGYKSGSYVVTTTREYDNLPANDLYFIPKSVVENGVTMALDDVKWAARSYENVGYTDVPNSYNATAKYTGKAIRSVPTGYLATAEYSGEIMGTVPGDTVYTAYFTGQPETATDDEPQDEPQVPQEKAKGSVPVVPLICVASIIALLGGAGAFWFTRKNVLIFRVDADDYRVLAAKHRLVAKAPVIDLTPLEGDSFELVIDKFSAKILNGVTVEIKSGASSLIHNIAYEGNAYTIAVNFSDNTIRAIY